MQRLSKNPLLVGSLLILVFVLLVGHRLGFIFAGGTGYEPTETVWLSTSDGAATETLAGLTQPIEHSIPRGGIVETGPGARAEFINGSVVLLLSENTQVEFKTLTKARMQILIHKGRLIVSNNETSGRTVTVSSLGVDATISGNTSSMSFVNYDFKQSVSVIPLQGNVTVATTNGAEVTSTPLDILDVTPFTITPTTINLNIAKDFYDWYRSMSL